MHPRAAHSSPNASLALALALGLLGCEAREPAPGPAPRFEADVQPILKARCVSCHGGEHPDAGWSAQSYFGAIACTDSGEAATVAGPGDDAPLLRALQRPDHAKLLDAKEDGVLRAWIEAGAPSAGDALHPAGWLDPRSPRWHGAVLREQGFAPMLGLGADDACGRCHEGAPASSWKLTAGAERAAACTSCHDRPGGVLACGTCHGDGADRGFPPRDPCFFPEGPAGGAHAAHAGDSKLRARPLACTTCHPATDLEDPLTGSHGDGQVDVVLGAQASYDADTGRCTVSCHARKGSRPTPSWTDDDELLCGDCHGAPPAEHFPGGCSACHPGVDDAGTALTDHALHADGRVDLGRDGTQRCGSCHGAGGDPWPATGAHAAHQRPALAPMVACTSCHVVPASVRSAGHLDRDAGAEVTLGALATLRGASARYDPATKTCSEVACHGAQLLGGVLATPRWRDAQPGQAQCGSCHALPPGPPHPADTSCEATLCHGAEISPGVFGPMLTEAGRFTHVDGNIDVGRQ